MEPSSLVLVAIIGVWAAYLVPHWLRRRAELAESRTPDRFSSRLRVLNRRVRSSRSSSHRSAGSVLTSPRVVVDVDGELLYVPAREPKATVAKSASATKVTVPVVPVVAARPALSKSDELVAALVNSHHAARRRALIMLMLFGLTVAAGASIPLLTAPVWVAASSSVVLVLHLLASRSAAIRSRERLAVLAVQARAVPVAPRTFARRSAARPAVAALAAASAGRPAAVAPARPARRPAVAAGSETWDPIPVPAPTYTLKPAVFRPEPPPLDLPAVASASRSAVRTATSRTGAVRTASVSRPAAVLSAVGDSAGSVAAAGLSAAGRATGADAGSRGSLPRRAEDIERILALDNDPLGLQERTAVNG